MRTRFTLVFLATCALFAVTTTLTPTKASAQSLYAGLIGGYAGTTDNDPTRDVESYGGGGGLSAGVTLPVMPIYLGARALWFVGDSGTLSTGAASLVLDSHYVLYGIDLGYDLILGPIVLRPGLGIGSAILDNSGAAVGLSVTASDSSLYLAPGVGLIVKLGLLYVGGELRYTWLTEEKHFSNVSMLASLGVTI